MKGTWVYEKGNQEKMEAQSKRRAKKREDEKKLKAPGNAQAAEAAAKEQVPPEEKVPVPADPVPVSTGEWKLMQVLVWVDQAGQPILPLTCKLPELETTASVPAALPKSWTDALPKIVISKQYNDFPLPEKDGRGVWPVPGFNAFQGALKAAGVFDSFAAHLQTESGNSKNTIDGHILALQRLFHMVEVDGKTPNTKARFDCLLMEPVCQLPFLALVAGCLWLESPLRVGVCLCLFAV